MSDCLRVLDCCVIITIHQKLHLFFGEYCARYESSVTSFIQSFVYVFVTQIFGDNIFAFLQIICGLLSFSMD